MSNFKKGMKNILPPIMILLVSVLMFVDVYNDILMIEEEKCWKKLENTANSINNEIAVRFQDNVMMLKLASTAMVQENKIEYYNMITEYINSFQDRTIFSRIDVIYPDNSVLFQSGEMKEVGYPYTFDTFISKGEEMSNRMLDKVSGKEVIYYTVPIIDKADVRALLVGVIECEKMPTFFKMGEYEGYAYSCIVDYRDGKFIMNNWQNELGDIYNIEQSEQLKGDENINLVTDIKHAKTGVSIYKSRENEKNSYIYYTPIGIFDWQMLIVVEENIIFGSLLIYKDRLIIAGATATVLLILYLIWTIFTAKQLESSKAEAEEKQAAFEVLSYIDTLTMLYNRNKYNQIVEEYQEVVLQNTGVAFFDLNGLKKINDEKGHKDGDNFIKNAAYHIQKFFAKEAFRIGGDEFVIIVVGIEEHLFNKKIHELKKELEDNNVSISVGVVWKQRSEDIEEQLKEADNDMYQNKELHYKELNSKEEIE
ncbi:MAG: sensor domain-containing diguanylate cyclase [Cellulosilyticaceae bacterium]